MRFMESSTENHGQTLKLPFQFSLQMADHGEPDISVFEQQLRDSRSTKGIGRFNINQETR